MHPFTAFNLTGRACPPSFGVWPTSVLPSFGAFGVILPEPVPPIARAQVSDGSTAADITIFSSAFSEASLALVPFNATILTEKKWN
jgi:hypothetical protein